MGRVEQAGAAAARLLGSHPMRRTVGAQKEFGAAADRCRADREPVLFPLHYRQAVGVRTQAALEQRVPIEMEMLGSNRGGDIGRSGGR